MPPVVVAVRRRQSGETRVVEHCWICQRAETVTKYCRRSCDVDGDGHRGVLLLLLLLLESLLCRRPRSVEQQKVLVEEVPRRRQLGGDLVHFRRHVQRRTDVDV